MEVNDEITKSARPRYFQKQHKAPVGLRLLFFARPANAFVHHLPAMDTTTQALYQSWQLFIKNANQTLEAKVYLTKHIAFSPLLSSGLLVAEFKEK